MQEARNGPCCVHTPLCGCSRTLPLQLLGTSTWAQPAGTACTGAAGGRCLGCKSTMLLTSHPPLLLPNRHGVALLLRPHSQLSPCRAWHPHTTCDCPLCLLCRCRFAWQSALPEPAQGDERTLHLLLSLSCCIVCFC